MNVDHSFYYIEYVFLEEMELNISMLNLAFYVWYYASEANARCYIVQIDCLHNHG